MSLFLKLLHLISPHLILVTGVQHAFGIALVLLLFDAVRRGGLPAASAFVRPPW